MTRRVAINNQIANLRHTIKTVEADIRLLNNQLIRYQAELRKLEKMKEKRP